MKSESTEIRLTQFSHGAGCGCKISPAVLEQILHSDSPTTHFPELLVGNESKDDAAVYDSGDGNCIISTTDFFMPIVDDPFTFGSIASVNAISDVYAMGGSPVMAIAILGWPINKIPAEVAKSVLEGSRKVCLEAEIPLAGGHSIDCPEPVFGLAVTGRVRKEHLKRNDTAREGSLLYLTKPLGVGLVTTAHKKGAVKEAHYKAVVDSMLTLNWMGAEFGKLDYVTAMTDVTGFGLLGHLIEMCEGSGMSAEIEFSKVPVFDFVREYVAKKTIPGGTDRNWSSYGHKVSAITEEQKAILADPQTSGGLLVAVAAGQESLFNRLCHNNGCNLEAIGKIVSKREPVIKIAL